MKISVNILLSGAFIPLATQAFIINHPPPPIFQAQTSSSSLSISFFKTTPSSSSPSSIPPVPSTPTSHPLINRANEMLYTQSGFYSPIDESAFSKDFVFRGPYIGPLNKADYIQTMNAFKIYEALPDINPNAFGFSLDPKDPNRVWFIVRNTGTFTGELGLGNGRSVPPNGASLSGCPETFSMTFDSDRKLKYLTVGYVADRFEGNTEGKGAAVGIFKAIGFPFPEPGPVLRFAQYVGTEVLAGESGPLSYSSKDVPEWWTDGDKGVQGF